MDASDPESSDAEEQTMEEEEEDDSNVQLGATYPCKRKDGTYRDGEVVKFRMNKRAGREEYLVHYVGLTRRQAEWVDKTRLVLSKPVKEDDVENGAERKKSAGSSTQNPRSAKDEPLMKKRKVDTSVGVCKDKNNTCLICAEPKDPVVVKCGHRFCRRCINKALARQDSFSCPFCKKVVTEKNTVPRGNRANMPKATATTAKSFLAKPVAKAKAQPLVMCPDHSEKLKLFCKDDGALCCLICRDSLKHTGHSFLPVMDAAEVYRARMLSAVAPLEGILKDVSELTNQQSEKVDHLQNVITECWQHVTSEFGNLYSFLKQQKEKLLKQLQEQSRSNLEVMETMSAQMEESRDSLRETFAVANMKMADTDGFALLDGIRELLVKCREQKEAAKSSTHKVIERTLCRGTFKCPIQYFTWKQMEPLVTGPKEIWIFGDGFITVANRQAETGSLGLNLGFDAQTCTVRWCSVKNAWSDVLSKLKQLIKIPDIILFHSDSDDLGDVDLTVFFKSVLNCIGSVDKFCPNTEFILSTLLPKPEWWGEPVEHWRKAFNAYLTERAQNPCFHLLRHDDLEKKLTDRYTGGDLGSLTDVETDLFLTSIRDALQKLMLKDCKLGEKVQSKSNVQEPDKPSAGKETKSVGTPGHPSAGKETKSEVTSDQPSVGKETKSEVTPDQPSVGKETKSEVTPDQPSAGKEVKSVVIPDQPSAGKEVKSVVIPDQPSAGKEAKPVVLHVQPSADKEAKSVVIPDQSSAGKEAKAVVIPDQSSVGKEAKSVVIPDQSSAGQEVKSVLVAVQRSAGKETKSAVIIPSVIWIVGDGFMNAAQHRAKTGPLGVNLGFEEQTCNIKWCSLSKSWFGLFPILKTLGQPDVILFHLGSSDLADAELKPLLNAVKGILKTSEKIFPYTEFIVSTLLPKPEWVKLSLEYRLKLFNSYLAKRSEKPRYLLLRHNELEKKLLERYKKGDRSSLTDSENDFFLTSLRDALQKAIFKVQKPSDEDCEELLSDIPSDLVLYEEDVQEENVQEEDVHEEDVQEDVHEEDVQEDVHEEDVAKLPDQPSLVKKVDSATIIGNIQQPTRLEKVEAPEASVDRPGPKDIWIVGNGFATAANRRAKLGPLGLNLGFDTKLFNIHWRNVSETWLGLFFELKQQSSGWRSPDVILFHSGGSDLGNVVLKTLTMSVKGCFSNVEKFYPKTEFIASTLLLRPEWRGKPLEQEQKEFNAFLSTYAQKPHFHLLKHEELEKKISKRYLTGDDGPLTAPETDMFLTDIRTALQKALLLDCEPSNKKIEVLPSGNVPSEKVKSEAAAKVTNQPSSGKQAEPAVTKPKEIWILGNSYISRASVHAVGYEFGKNLGFDEQQWVVRWTGKTIRLVSLLTDMHHMARNLGMPNIVFVHVGSNDLGILRYQAMIEDFTYDITRLAKLFPNTQFIFSSILPRSEWLASSSEEYRKKFNTVISEHAVRCGFEVSNNSRLENTLLMRFRGGRLYGSLTYQENDMFLTIIRLSIQQAIMKGGKQVAGKSEPRKELLPIVDKMVIVVPGTDHSESTEDEEEIEEMTSVNQI